MRIPRWVTWGERVETVIDGCLVPDVLLFDVGENPGEPRHVGVGLGRRTGDTRRESSVTRFVVGQCRADLFEVVATLRPPRRLAHHLHGGERDAHQNANDGYHHQEFDESEGASNLHRRFLYWRFIIYRVI